MLNIQRVIEEIRHVGLYDLVLQDIQKFTGKENPSIDEVRDTLEKSPQILRDYMQTTVEYNLSNIHLRDIDLNEVSNTCKAKAEKVNKNLALLRKIEKYTLDFEQSATLVIIFSVEFFVLFSVQYFIVLLDLKEYQWYIYGMFGASILAAWWYANKQKQKYDQNNNRYKRVYQETMDLLSDLEHNGCIEKESLYIRESDEHI